MIEFIIFVLIAAALAAFVYVKVTGKDPKVVWASVVAVAGTVAADLWVRAGDLWAAWF